MGESSGSRSPASGRGSPTRRPPVPAREGRRQSPRPPLPLGRRRVVEGLPLGDVLGENRVGIGRPAGLLQLVLAPGQLLLEKPRHGGRALAVRHEGEEPLGERIGEGQGDAHIMYYDTYRSEERRVGK